MANLAISEATALLMSALQSATFTLSDSFKMTKATVVSPLISWATDITAASDVAGWAEIQSSISAVEIRWPAINFDIQIFWKTQNLTNIYNVVHAAGDLKSTVLVTNTGIASFIHSLDIWFLLPESQVYLDSLQNRYWGSVQGLCE